MGRMFPVENVSHCYHIIVRWLQLMKWQNTTLCMVRHKSESSHEFSKDVGDSSIVDFSSRFWMVIPSQRRGQILPKLKMSGKMWHMIICFGSSMRLLEQQGLHHKLPLWQLRALFSVGPDKESKSQWQRICLPSLNVSKTFCISNHLLCHMPH